MFDGLLAGTEPKKVRSWAKRSSVGDSVRSGVTSGEDVHGTQQHIELAGCLSLRRAWCLVLGVLHLGICTFFAFLKSLQT